ncbi:MAG TPA: hypothetical protein VMS30_07430 [Phycisphaerales bacterium]|nr:hypothetical protein [Phycisphaerales bacterium]
MKHKTWFRLVLKAIGVLLIGIALPTCGQLAAHVLSYVFIDATNSIFGNDYWAIQSLYLVGGLLQMAFGLYLFLGGKWIVDKAIPSNRPYCPECGYDMSRAQGARCPECGVELPRDSAGAVSRDVQVGSTMNHRHAHK